MLRQLRLRSWNFETNLFGRNRTDVYSILAQSLALWRLDDGRAMLVSRFHNRWLPLFLFSFRITTGWLGTTGLSGVARACSSL